MTKIKISMGFVRDIDGIWHRMDAAARFYVKVFKRKGQHYSQVLGEYREVYEYSKRGMHGPGIIEFTGEMRGKKKAQAILDEGFGCLDES